MPRRSKPSSFVARLKVLFRRSKVRMPWPCCRRLPSSTARTNAFSSTSRAAATRTSSPWRSTWEPSCDVHRAQVCPQPGRGDRAVPGVSDAVWSHSRSSGAGPGGMGRGRTDGALPGPLPDGGRPAPPAPVPHASRRVMTRLASAFAKGRPALVTFITAGDGDTAANLDALVEGGADVIELGMPFTDPMADGPAIQAANLRSLGKGTTTADVLAIAKGFRQRHPDVPLVFMGYANPMIRRGPEWFAEQCRESGVDGVIYVDLAPEEDP